VKLSDLGGSAENLLEAFAAQLVAADPDFPLPGPRYVGSGEIPWDGEGLYVYLGMGHTGQPGKPETQSFPSAHASVFAVTFYIQLVRRVSTFGYAMDGLMDIPSDDVLNEEGVRAVSDAGALLAAAAVIKQSDKISARSTGFVVGQITPIGPRGGFAAMRLWVDISIDEA
jgi:hypothetical protein